jgi:hypothetical protein
MIAEEKASPEAPHGTLQVLLLGFADAAKTISNAKKRSMSSTEATQAASIAIMHRKMCHRIP